MKLVTYCERHHQDEQAGLMCRGMVINCASALAYFHRDSHGEKLTMLEIIANEAVYSKLQTVEQHLIQLPGLEWKRIQQQSWVHSLAEINLLAPLPRPRSLRDFYAFEAHVKTCRAKRGLAMVDEWYQLPVFYFSNHQAITAPHEVIQFPKKSSWRDFELELAIIIGKEGRDISVANAWDHIFGLTIFNDWSARDLQIEEVKVGLGPAKAKDFASSLGPYLATPDEWQDRIDGEKLSLSMKAFINGKQVSEGNSVDLYWTIPQLLARASEDVTLYPGDVIGTGTVGTGCLLEQAEPNWLKAGDEVTLEIERLGKLQNRIG